MKYENLNIFYYDYDKDKKKHAYIVLGHGDRSEFDFMDIVYSDKPDTPVEELAHIFKKQWYDSYVSNKLPDCVVEF